MIAHVAEAGEVKGRVVLRLGMAPTHDSAIEAAIRLAKAFQSEIESLFVEDVELFACATHGFAREIGFGGRVRRLLSPEQLAADLSHAARAARRHVDEVARGADVRIVHRVVRADPTQALQQACTEIGPWNVIVLGAPLGASSEPQLRLLMQAVTDAQGLVVVGPRVRRAKGPIVVALEHADHLPGMMHAAERLSRAGGDPIVVLMVAATLDDLAALEGQTRLLLAGRDDVELVAVHAAHGDPADVVEPIFRIAGSFLLAELGGLAVPTDHRFALAATAIECPIFLVR